MSEHVASVRWERGGLEFSYDTYSRDHVWRFESGIEVQASANPIYLGSGKAVDPEEAFVASIASCHMLTLLAIAARKRLVVESYADRAVGVMSKNEQGRLAVTSVALHPEIAWAGEAPADDVLARMHELAHQDCFIANSVRTTITVTSTAD
jgi:organic hydroperoxide reductase OsmC/OhrA